MDYQSYSLLQDFGQNMARREGLRRKSRVGVAPRAAKVAGFASLRPAPRRFAPCRPSGPSVLPPFNLNLAGPDSARLDCARRDSAPFRLWAGAEAGGRPGRFSQANLNGISSRSRPPCPHVAARASHARTASRCHEDIGTCNWGHDKEGNTSMKHEIGSFLIKDPWPTRCLIVPANQRLIERQIRWREV